RFPEYDTPINIGKIITVIGGGNTALDSARVALRLGAEKVIIIYRRTEVEMPARKQEYLHAIDEGIEFQFLTNPLKIIGDDKNNVKKLKLIKMRLGKLDASGRRKTIPIKKTDFLINTDTVILAIGTRVNPIITKSIPELKLNSNVYIKTDEFGRTNIKDIFAGGDITTGTATVISAMAAGYKVANVIDEYLKNIK
ncbi:MAG: FAD-dependent oxidoreductase, partial [Candidatus Thorarchaeota archaeon]